MRLIGATMSGVRLSMIDAGYILQPGDLIWTDFDPRMGREQSGRRPALVISLSMFHEASGFAIVCPITSRIRNYGSSVILPEGLPVEGEILTSHVRSIDKIARPVRFAGAAVPEGVLTEVRVKLAVLCGM